MALIDALLLDPHPFEFWVADRPEKGSGTLNDPFGAANAADFDALINSLPESSRIHLGPGEFETVGYYDGGSSGIRPRRALRISGAGMEATTLKVVGSFTADKHSGRLLKFHVRADIDK